MKKKYKLLLLISNIFLLVFILNVFVSFIVFAKSWVNGLLIFALCLVNILIALRASFDATENK
ncbi:hypothetical protein [uncultured Polaribacter sp.]|uniref:hypothetical protein n=1 Tax=uncultured Polaribacter sp. TaxID=174711 RepID=UPI0026099C73|nr:hypothetical protein [uncultured Polaribacter sp.]